MDTKREGVHGGRIDLAVRNSTAVETVRKELVTGKNDDRSRTGVQTEAREQVIQLFREVQPVSTRKSYGQYQREYLAWAAMAGLNPKGDNAEVTAAAFITALANHPSKRVGQRTILSTVTGAIADLYRFTHEHPPTQSNLVTAAKAIAIQKLPRALHDRTSQLIPFEVLTKAVTTLTAKKTPTAYRDAAMILTGLTMFPRPGEVTRVTLGDVIFTKDRMEEGKGEQRHCVVVQIKKAKNDQKGEGHPRRAYMQDDEHESMCAYRAIERWLLVRPTVAGKEGGWDAPLFCNISAKGRGKALSRATPNHIVKEALKAIGEDTEHRTWTSLRKTGVSKAHAAGVDSLTIMRAGNWRSASWESYRVMYNRECADLCDGFGQ